MDGYRAGGCRSPNLVLCDMYAATGFCRSYPLQILPMLSSTLKPCVSQASWRETNRRSHRYLLNLVVDSSTFKSIDSTGVFLETTSVILREAQQSTLHVYDSLAMHNLKTCWFVWLPQSFWASNINLRLYASANDWFLFLHERPISCWNISVAVEIFFYLYRLNFFGPILSRGFVDPGDVLALGLSPQSSPCSYTRYICRHDIDLR
jgi:hypothetical protein